TNTHAVFVPPPSTPRIRSPGFTIVIVGQAHRLPRVFFMVGDGKGASDALALQMRSRCRDFARSYRAGQSWTKRKPRSESSSCEEKSASTTGSITKKPFR